MTEPNTTAAPAEATPTTGPVETAPAPAADQNSTGAAGDVRAPMQVPDASVDPASGEKAQEKAEGEGAPQDLLGEEPQEADESAKVLGAPQEGYKFEPAPDANVHLGEEAYQQFGEIAKELNLSQEAAQKIVNGMEPLLQRTVQRHRENWIAASRQDKEFGGANFETNIKAINRAYMATTTPELRAVLSASGLVNHPEVLRHFYGLSKTLSDGRFVTSQGAQERADRSDPRNFYKGMNP